MGGLGSGYYFHWKKKTTVEACLCLDANYWMRKGVLRAGLIFSSACRWTDGRTGEEQSAIGYTVDTLDLASARLQLNYTNGEETIHYAIPLQVTYPHFGGLRWWFVCPLERNERLCNQRVGKLYLPPAGRYFGCRHCYELTYRSVQKHDKRVDFLRKNPALALAILKNRQSAPLNQFLRAIDALF